MGAGHWDPDCALVLLGRVHMDNIIVQHLAIAIRLPDHYSTGCTLIGRKSSTTTRHASTLAFWAFHEAIASERGL